MGISKKRGISKLTHPKSLGWRLLKICFNDFDTFQIWFVVMICLWLGFAVMILIWFQLWFWYGFSYDSWCGSNLWFEASPSEPYPKYSKIVSKPYQNRIKTVSKSYQKRIKIKIVSKSYQNHKNLRQIDQKPVPGLFLFLFLKPTHWNHIKTVSKSYQKRIKIVSKSYQNQIKTQKPAKNRPKTCPWAVSVSLFEANSLEPYQNRIKLISKSYQNRNKTHIEIITPNSKHIKFISSNRIQNHIEIVKKTWIQHPRGIPGL